MKDVKWDIYKITLTAILGIIAAIGIGLCLIRFFYNDFGSRGISNIQMSFDINGEVLKAGHGVYVRYGEGYYLPLTETTSLLGLGEEAHFRGNKVIVILNNELFEYYFHSKKLLKDGESLENCGTAFIMKEGTVYLSTLFMENALGCRISAGGEEENRIYISNGRFTAKDFDYSWAEGSKYIAHALGGIGDKDYTNSLEAFEENYRKGFRNFEIDLEYTSDGELVLIHSWERATLKELFSMDVPADNLETPLSLKEFKERTIYGNLTPLEFREILEIMVEHPDIYIVLDGKYDDEENVKKEYSDIVKLTDAVSPALKDRLIPQIYNEAMYEWVMSAYDFKSMIFSWYRYGSAGLEPEPLFDFCEERGIRACAMKDSLENALLDKEAFKRDLYIFVYTINEERDRDRLFNNGVKGIYTDFLFE